MTTKKSPSKATKKEVVEEAPVYVSTDDRISKIESTMTNLAQVLERIETRQSDKNIMPIAKSAEARVEAMRRAGIDKVGQATRTKDLLHPKAEESGFRQNDIVRLADDCSKAEFYRSNTDGFPANEDEEWEPALGVVMNYMYTKRKGQRKYKVNFPNFGKDGFTENELVLVKGA